MGFRSLFQESLEWSLSNKVSLVHGVSVFISESLERSLSNKACYLIYELGQNQENCFILFEVLNQSCRVFGSALEPPSNRSFVCIDSERSLINVKGELRSLHIAIILPFCIFLEEITWISYVFWTFFTKMVGDLHSIITRSNWLFILFN